MSDRSEIQKTQRTVARLERQYALEQVRKRKRDTRRKIELGGLVIKANLSDLPKDVVLGLLVQAAYDLQNDEFLYHLYELKGQAAFMDYGEK